jgi:hypothetical protein
MAVYREISIGSRVVSAKPAPDITATPDRLAGLSSFRSGSAPGNANARRARFAVILGGFGRSGLEFDMPEPKGSLRRLLHSEAAFGIALRLAGADAPANSRMRV